MLATPQGPANFEVTLDDVRLLTDNGSGIVTHTNHCLHPDLLPINNQFPELIESHPRKARIDALLTNQNGPLTIDQLKTALRDHDNHPKSICRHANDHPQHGFWETVFSVILDPSAGQMHVTRGTPCVQPYETYSLN